MTELQTDPRLLAAMQSMTVTRLSRCEAEKQRISFVMGVIGKKNTSTRERVREILERADPEKGEV